MTARVPILQLSSRALIWANEIAIGEASPFGAAIAGVNPTRFGIALLGSIRVFRCVHASAGRGGGECSNQTNLLDHTFPKSSLPNITCYRPRLTSDAALCTLLS